jgi:hypothetical protein
MFRESAKMWIFSEYFCGFFKLFCWRGQSDRIFRFFTNCGCLYLVAIRATIFLVHLQDPGKVSAFGQKPGGKNPDFHITRCYMTTHVLAIVVLALRSRRYRSLLPAGDYSNGSYLTAQQSPDGQTIYLGAEAARRKPRLMLRTPGSPQSE